MSERGRGGGAQTLVQRQSRESHAQPSSPLLPVPSTTLLSRCVRGMDGWMVGCREGGDGERDRWSKRARGREGRKGRSEGEIKNRTPPKNTHTQPRTPFHICFEWLSVMEGSIHLTPPFPLKFRVHPSEGEAYRQRRGRRDHAGRAAQAALPCGSRYKIGGTRMC